MPTAQFIAALIEDLRTSVSSTVPRDRIYPPFLMTLAKPYLPIARELVPLENAQ